MFTKTLIFLACFCIILTIEAANSIGYFVGNDFGLPNSVTPSIKLEVFGNSIYYIGFINRGTWYEAMQFCNYHHMNLLSIETKEENDFLHERMKTLFGGGSEYWFWSSGTTLSNNRWVWISSGRPIIYSNWFPNQPDNAGGKEHCLEVRYNYHNGILWNDNNCDTTQLHIICEAVVWKNVTDVLLNMCKSLENVPSL